MSAVAEVEVVEIESETQADSRVFLAESYFEQGSDHEVCEDYASHGEKWTAFADGCSNGGGPPIDSDWGARFNCAAAQEKINIADNPQEFLPAVGQMTLQSARAYASLAPSCLRATLGVMRPVNNGTDIRSLLVGDGIIGGKRRDGRFKIHIIDFLPGGTRQKGAPFYLSYKTCNETDIYISEFGGRYKVTTYFGNLLDPKMDYLKAIKSEGKTPKGEAPLIEEREAAWGQVMTETVNEYDLDLDKPYFTTDFSTNEYELLFGFSDGPQAFRYVRKKGASRNKEVVHTLDVLRVLLDIRDYNPTFLRRQRSWAFRQNRPGTFYNLGWFGEDDVSCGAIYCGEN